MDSGLVREINIAGLLTISSICRTFVAPPDRGGGEAGIWASRSAASHNPGYWLDIAGGHEDSRACAYDRDARDLSSPRRRGAVSVPKRRVRRPPCGAAFRGESVDEAPLVRKRAEVIPFPLLVSGGHRRGLTIGQILPFSGRWGGASLRLSNFWVTYSLFHFSGSAPHYLCPSRGGRLFPFAISGFRF